MADMEEVEYDPVSKPRHYNKWPVEVIEITRYLSFDIGNAVKYMLRHNDKGKPTEDIEKAIWYLRDAMKYEGYTMVYISKKYDGTFPHVATLALTRLLIADARTEKPLDPLVVEALIEVADGYYGVAIKHLEKYLAVD